MKKITLNQMSILLNVVNRNGDRFNDYNEALNGLRPSVSKFYFLVIPIILGSIYLGSVINAELFASIIDPENTIQHGVYAKIFAGVVSVIGIVCGHMLSSNTLFSIDQIGSRSINPLLIWPFIFSCTYLILIFSTSWFGGGTQGMVMSGTLSVFELLTGLILYPKFSILWNSTKRAEYAEKCYESYLKFKQYETIYNNENDSPFSFSVTQNVIKAIRFYENNEPVEEQPVEKESQGNETAPKSEATAEDDINSMQEDNPEINDEQENFEDENLEV